MNAIAMRDIIRLKDICEELVMTCASTYVYVLEVHGRDLRHHHKSSVHSSRSSWYGLGLGRA